MDRYATGQITIIDSTDDLRAKLITLTSTDQILKVAVDEEITPSTATITATTQNIEAITWEYSINGGTTWTSTHAAINIVGNTATLTASLLTTNSITIKASGDGVSDILTIVKIFDGIKGDPGAPGDPAYTIVLSNESHTFQGSESAALVDSTTTTTITAYKGTEAQNILVGTISGAPTGMSISINDNSTTAPVITFTVTGAITTTGTISIPLTIDGKFFTKIFSYSISFKGANAKSLKITSDNLIFTTDSSGVVSPDCITLTASKQNTTGAVTWSSDPSIDLYTAATEGLVVGTTSADIVYLRKEDFGSNSAITITANIDADSLADKLMITLDKEKISGSQIFGNNIITIASSTNGKYLDVDGVENTDIAWMYTSLIPVKPQESYIVSGYTDLGTTQAVCFYNAEGTFISGSGIAGSSRQTFTIPEGSAYMKFSFKEADQTIIKLEKGTVATPYTKPIEEATPTSTNNSLYKWDATNSRWELSYIGKDALDETVIVNGVLSSKLLTANNILTGTLDADYVTIKNLRIGSNFGFDEGYDPTKITIGGTNLIESSFLMLQGEGTQIQTTKQFYAETWAYQIISNNNLKNILVAGQQYTFSFECYLDTRTAIPDLYQFQTGFLLWSPSTKPGVSFLTNALVDIGNSEKISITFTCPEIDDHVLLCYTNRYTTGGGEPVGFDKVVFSNLKLENGNKATNWTPALKDTENFFLENISSVKQTADGVSQAFDDYQTKMNGYITLADGTITLGVVDPTPGSKPVRLELDNDSIDFKNTDYTFLSISPTSIKFLSGAEFTNSAMNVPIVDITEKLKINGFSFTIASNGSLNFNKE